MLNLYIYMYNIENNVGRIWSERHFPLEPNAFHISAFPLSLSFSGLWAFVIVIRHHSYCTHGAFRCLTMNYDYGLFY